MSRRRFQADLQWAEKHPEQALSVLPWPRTPNEYRQALNAQLTANNVNAEEAKALLDEYDRLYTSAAKKFEESRREQAERLRKALSRGRACGREASTLSRFHG